MVRPAQTARSERTREALRLITGQELLLADNPLLARSMANRFPYMDPLNHLQIALLARHPITPQISDHDAQHLHLHVATGSGSVAEQVVGESLLGLSTLVCDLGADRLGVCASATCDNAFVDASPNRSRRYCSERCSSRANVAAYRARQKAGA